MNSSMLNIPVDSIINCIASSIWIKVALYIVLAPVAGGLLAGIDRKFTAYMQGRTGPPIIQPFYDILKLIKKENIKINRFQNFNIFLFSVLIILTGSFFFSGGELLLVMFSLLLAGVFFVLAGFSHNSPYSHIGAERELIQMMSYDPMILIVAIGMYMVTGTFNVERIATINYPLIAYLPGIFFGYCYMLTFKFRKSPFDLSMSHHAHQELVKGLVTEFSGKTLALIEVVHWYENIMLLGIVYLFFAYNPLIGIAVCLAVWIFETYIDNTFARFKWELAFKSAWIVTIIAGISNIIVLYFILPK
jgi:formate hydrogenlyase subunit 4